MNDTLYIQYAHVHIYRYRLFAHSCYQYADIIIDILQQFVCALHL